MTLATVENVIALDRAVWWISNPRRWCRGSYFLDGRRCASGAVRENALKPFAMLSVLDELNMESFCLYGKYSIEDVNDNLGRIPAKHVIESLAAKLRSELNVNGRE